MWNVTTKVIAKITAATAKSYNKFKKYRGSTTSRNYRKQTYWTLHIYLGKY
jgi:hypothetical protein